MEVFLTLPYHNKGINLSIPAKKLIDNLVPKSGKLIEDVPKTLKQVLRHPSGTPRLRTIAGKCRTAVIVIDDATRSVPSALLIDAIMEELIGGGIQPPEVSILAATGLHRSLTPKETEAALCQWYGILRFENHDASDVSKLTYIGTTRLGTRVSVNSTFMQADLKILTGDVEYHQFCGYGGGGKSIYPGLASAKAIRENHSRLELSGTGPGKLEDNPVRKEIDEVTRMAGADFLLCTVLDSSHRIVDIQAGDVMEAFRSATRTVDRIYRATVPEPADLVIASPGGYPKDATLYQSQKAISSAVRLAATGGDVAIVAACIEGSGSKRFETWMEQAETPQDIVSRIRDNFEMGGHKAYQIARDVLKARIHLFSKLPADSVTKWFMHPLKREQQINRLIKRARKIIVLPQASLTLGEVDSEGEKGEVQHDQ